ncbi:kinesin-like protein KIF12 isoform X1 [Meleagris gallopavo]|uniref:kinesin-like protein KIF12 isoform X1 n=1 Tax=Meleagris gallopavo TaxID=9103 RepID=UPI000939CD2D|nr:kinesin-like protein KIF12 isoform X1 [Meleagris gallopavo]
MEAEEERGWRPQAGTRPKMLPRSQLRLSPGEEQEGRETRLRVVLRVRPLTCTETRRGDRHAVHSLGNGIVHVSAARHDATFTFSAVFDGGASQEAVFEGSGMQQLVELAVEGFSCTVFAYGQTGSGKTYTLMGPLGQSDAPGLLGLMQRSFSCLLEQSRGTGLALSASYLEIYNEQVRDLLSAGPPRTLPLRWSKTRGFYVENQLSVDFESLEAVTELLLQGAGLWSWGMHGRYSPGPPAAFCSSRFPKATDLCARPQWALEPQPRHPDHPHPQPSSEPFPCCGDMGRDGGLGSGGVLQPQGWGCFLLPKDALMVLGRAARTASQTQEVTQRGRDGWDAGQHHHPNVPPQPGTSKQGTLCFVDLAGSEQVKDTGSSGELSVEANNINRSLLALGHCISLLAKPRGKRMHIPYRDSKLTRLLARSLDGSGITLMVACVSPSSRCLSETLSTLHYASRARKVTTRPMANRVPREKLLQTLEEEIQSLKLENLSLRQQLSLPRSREVPGAWPGWVGRYSLGGLHCPPLEGQVAAEGAPAWPSLYGLLRDFVVENEQLRQPQLPPGPSSGGIPTIPSCSQVPHRSIHIPLSHPSWPQHSNMMPTSTHRLPKLPPASSCPQCCTNAIVSQGSASLPLPAQDDGTVPSCWLQKGKRNQSRSWSSLRQHAVPQDSQETAGTEGRVVPSAPPWPGPPEPRAAGAIPVLQWEETSEWLEELI